MTPETQDRVIAGACPFSRRGSASLLAAFFVLASATCSAPSDRPPNIILVLVDTLRADHLGSYGFEGDISPHLDELAAESVLFEHCYSQAPWTPPSMGTLFTSLHPRVHGLNSFQEQKFVDPESGSLRATVLPDEAVTLAEVLQKAGYQTAAFVTNPWVEASLGMGQGFDLYHDERTGRDVSADEIKDLARRWLHSRSDDRPFFLYLHFMDVHDPWNAPRRDFEALRDHVAGEDRLLQPSEVPPEEIEIRPDWASDEMRLQMGYWKTRYASGVRAFDQRFAPLLRYLRESGILDDSYLVLTSDHGDEMYENGRWGHGYSLHEHQLHVPLLVRRPGGADAGRAVPEMIGLIDLMPTLLKLAGVAPPDGIRGKDVSALLDGGSADRTPLFFASSMMWGPDIYSVRTERHKLIADTAGDWMQLFDLIEDPTEQNDLAGENEELAAALREFIDEHLKATEHGRLERETREVEQDLLERLRSLGYVE